jgi:hypothetical protein
MPHMHSANGQCGGEGRRRAESGERPKTGGCSRAAREAGVEEARATSVEEAGGPKLYVWPKTDNRCGMGGRQSRRAGSCWLVGGGGGVQASARANDGWLRVHIVKSK